MVSWAVDVGDEGRVGEHVAVVDLRSAQSAKVVTSGPADTMRTYEDAPQVYEGEESNEAGGGAGQWPSRGGGTADDAYRYL